MEFQARLQDILLPPPVPAGMNPLLLMSMTYHYRSCSEDLDPIMLRRVNGTHWRIVDGRHRFIASLIAGRNTILAEEGFVAHHPV